MQGTESEALTRVALRLADAAGVTVLTGAGVSAASGVPTFRGPGGLWRQHRPESLATADAFARDPRLVWEWYDWRRQTIAGCEPNAAHQVIAAWGRRLRGFQLVTQNVDGLHERAGSAGVIRLHGSIWHLRCWNACGGSGEWRDQRVPLPALPPSCPACGGLARPAVVWFGEPLDPRAWTAADAAVRCAVFLAVGTSAVVQPAASLVARARDAGAFVVEVNPEATPASGEAAVTLRGSAHEVLPQLDALIHTGS